MPPKRKTGAGNGAKTNDSRSTRKTASKNDGSGGSGASPDKTAPPPKIGTGKHAYHDFGTGKYEDIEHHRKTILDDMQKKELAVMDGADGMHENILKKHKLQAELKNATGRKKSAIQKEIDNADKYIADRRYAYDDWKLAVALYEDFLYYQNPRHRQNFIRMDPVAQTKQDQNLAKKIGKLPPAIFSASEHYNQMMEPYVRGMRISRVGVASRLERTATHQELHLRTPVWRRQPCGVGRPENRPRETPLQFELDLDQIEERRLKVDSIPDDGTRDVKHTSHQARRAAQSLDSAVPGFQGSWDRLKTPGGLYISAMEDSDDWPTSCDYAGPLRDSFVAAVPKPTNNRRNETARDDSPSMSTKLDDRSDSEDFEFVRSPKRLKTDYKHEITIQWAGKVEPGRREWHTGNLLSPTSPLDAPSEKLDGPNTSVPQSTVPTTDERRLSPALDEDSDDEGDLFAQSYREGVEDLEMDDENTEE